MSGIAFHFAFALRLKCDKIYSNHVDRVQVINEATLSYTIRLSKAVPRDPLTN